MGLVNVKDKPIYRQDSLFKQTVNTNSILFSSLSSNDNLSKVYIAPFDQCNNQIYTDLEIHEVFQPNGKDFFRFLNGRAGSGKTYILKQAIKILHQYGYRVAIGAATNSAATELEGVTIHKLLNYKNNNIDKYNLERIVNDLYDFLIIDEAFMLSHLMIKELTLLIKEYSKKINKNFYVIICGDPCQIINKNQPIYDWEEFSLFYKTFQLDKNYRQNKETEKDKEWIQCLNQIREGDCSSITKFLSLYSYKELPNIIEDDSLIVAPTRKIVDEQNRRIAINFYRQKQPKQYLTMLGLSYSKKDYPTSLILFKGIRLCTREKVKTLQNIYLNKGTIFTILDINYEKQIIYISLFSNKKEFSINLRDCYVKEQLFYKETKESEEIFGEIDVLPFNFGYANTIHITQGITIKEPNRLYLILNETCRQFYGSIYVALSRTQSYKQITTIIDETEFNLYKSMYNPNFFSNEEIEHLYWDYCSLVHIEAVRLGHMNT